MTVLLQGARGRGRTLAIVLVGAGVASGLVVAALARPGDGGPGGPARRPAFRLCPQVSLRDPARRFALVDAELPNLGGNVMGRSLTYRDGPRRLSVNVGFDILDALEDLDFETTGSLRIGGRDVVLLASDALPRERLLAAVWEDARFQPPCDEFKVVAWNLEEGDLIGLLREVEVDRAGT